MNNYYMSNKWVKKLIIFLITLLLLITIAIIITQIYLNSNLRSNTEEISPGTNLLEIYGKSSTGGIDYNAYFDIKEYMQKYLDATNIKHSQYGYYDKNGDYISTANENEIKQKIYNLLSNKYITEKNITLENLYDHIDILQKSAIFMPIEASLIQDGDAGEIKSFLVHGLIQSAENYIVIDKIFAIINIDIVGAKYSLEPIDGDYNSIEEIKIEKYEDTIVKNEDNKFYQTSKRVKDIVAEYINIFRGLALGAPEKLYDLLDEEYRDVKFGNLNEFKNYIIENKAEIITVRLDKYQAQVDGNKVRYVCIDKRGNYYIINQNEPLSDYKMMLDIYTIDLKEFIEEYDSAENNKKVSLNIQKLIKATENEDYKYVYNKLNESFKASNFKTQEDFEEFIKEKYNIEDKIEYGKYEEIAGVHVYDIKITHKNNESTTEAQIVMKLEDNRDFEISFSEKK